MDTLIVRLNFLSLEATMSLFKSALCAALCVMGIGSASVVAGPLCIAGPLSSILHSTCTIGTLDFSFGNLNGGYHTDAPGRQELNFDDFSFTPVSSGIDYGFTVTLSTGVQTITAPSNGYAIAGASLQFTVITSDGYRSIYGLVSYGPNLSADGMTDARAYFGVGQTFNDDTFMEYRSIVCSPNPADCGQPYPAGVYVSGQNGTPFSSSHAGYFNIYGLYAQNGDSAGWNGDSATALIITGDALPPPPCTSNCNNPPPSGSVPEPASLALLGLGLAELGFSRRKKA